MKQRAGLCAWMAAAILLAAPMAVRAQDNAPIGTPQAAVSSGPEGREQRVFELTNEARSQAGVAPLTWDPALAKAAHDHATRMSQERSLSHRYDGEGDLAERAAAAGAQFSLIEENIAMAHSAKEVHDSWMHSPPHHANLVNGQVNRIGIALVEDKGVLYAVADYAQGVEAMTAEQVEAKVTAMLQARGVTVVGDRAAARVYCAQPGDEPAASGSGPAPRFFMRWQSADLSKLPPQLEQRIKGDQKAAVGACQAGGNGPGGAPVFAGFRVAVLVY